MHNLDTFGRAIRFRQTWRVQGEAGDIMDELENFQKILPSSSQLHRFRQNITVAEELSDIRMFLSERQEKASSRKNWRFTFRKKAFNEFLIEIFLDRVEKSQAPYDILGYRYFGLETDPLPDNMDFRTFKLMVVKQALLRFIDQVILLKEKITFSVILKGPKGRVEVRL